MSSFPSVGIRSPGLLLLGEFTGGERMSGDREKDVVVGSRHQDPDEVGFTQWRCGLYIAGDLNNFLMSTSAKKNP